MSQSKSFIGKSVKLENVNLSSEGSVKSTLNIVANDSKLKDLTLSGSWSKDISGNTMITVNYSHLKGGASCFTETTCIKVSLNVEDISPQALISVVPTVLYITL